MIDLTPVRKRLDWALEENQQATQKLLILLEGLEINQPLWEEITCHLADCQSHLNNALNIVQRGESNP